MLEIKCEIMARPSSVCGFCLIRNKHGRDIALWVHVVTEMKSFLIFWGLGFSICKMDLRANQGMAIKLKTFVLSWRSHVRVTVSLEMFAVSS